MVDLSRYLFEALRKDEEFILYRGRSQSDPAAAGRSRVPVLSPLAEHPWPESLKRLEHECSLGEALNPAWAARPIATERYWDRTVLVLEDPGGVPLDQLVGQPLELTSRLHLAIRLTTTIDRLHRSSIIHKDIKPANLMVNFETGQCWLTGFGIASRLPRESLWEAVRSGLVHRSENSYGFQHDRVQEAAYSRIPEKARAEAHLQIGRLLLARTSPDKREEIIFEIVSQFNRSTSLITSQDEREQLARLNPEERA